MIICVNMRHLNDDQKGLFVSMPEAQCSIEHLVQSWGKQSSLVPKPGFEGAALPTDIGTLLTLFEKMPEKQLFVRVSGLHLGDKCDMTRIPFAELDNVPEKLQSRKSQFHLQAVDLEKCDDRFSAFEDQITGYLAQHVPAFERQKTTCSIGVFLSTPGAVAPFHADIEHNFLLQMVGEKTFHSFPSNDYEMFTATHRERLAADKIHVLDTYNASFEQQCRLTQLKPGMMLYHPPMSPHWVSTSDASYALSYTVSLITEDVDQRQIIHKLNKRIRKFGLNPAEPGQSAVKDKVKIHTGAFLRKVKNLIPGAAT